MTERLTTVDHRLGCSNVQVSAGKIEQHNGSAYDFSAILVKVFKCSSFGQPVQKVPGMNARPQSAIQQMPSLGPGRH